MDTTQMSKEKAYLFASKALSILVILFGLSVLIGWYCHIEALIRYEEDTIAIVYNSALCFILIGVGILALIYKLKYIPQIISITVLILSSMVLAEHIFSLNLHIDELFFSHYDTQHNSFPGRMAPNTAVCFILSALVLLITTCHKCFQSAIILCLTISMIILTFALVFLSGYLGSLQNIYLWGHSTPMSTAAAVGFIVLSSNLICLFLYKAMMKDINLIKYMPFICALCMFIATLMLAIKIYQNEIEHHYSTRLPVTTFFSGAAISLLYYLIFYFMGKVGQNNQK